MNRFAKISMLTVILISSVALIGWWADHATLAAWLPGISDLTFNTAICFMLIAIACCLSLVSTSLNSSIYIGIALFVALFATLSLLQDLLFIDLGIDHLLFDSRGYALTSPYPGRMSPATAMGFLLSAVILVGLNRFKELSRSATIIHAIIMVLGLLSVLGVGMNLLMSDIPEYLAHFASMSLFTSIGFFMLTIVIAGLFERQYQVEGVHKLFYSGIQLMYALSYPKKFILISTVFAIPLVTLMWNEIQLLEKNVAETRLKITGIDHIIEISKLIVAIPEHRGMSNANLYDPGIFGGELKSKEEQIDQLFASNAMMIRRDIESMVVPREWAEIEHHWRNIKDTPQLPLLQWRLHTELIALLVQHVRDIGVTTRLSFDYDPMLHDLVTAQLVSMPDLFEKLAQLRGLGSGYISDKQISKDQQLVLVAMISQIATLLNESQSLVKLTLSYQQSNGLKGIEDLEQLAGLYASFIQAFLTTSKIELLGEKPRFSISTEDYFQQASLTLQHGYAFYFASFKFMHFMLVERINQDIIMLIPEEYRQRHLQGLQSFNKTGVGKVIGEPLEIHGLKKNGDEFPMELSITAMQLEGRQMFIGVVRDITQQHELENQLRHSQKMEAVGALVGGVAHNFNNLLAGILGKAYLAKIRINKHQDALPYLDSIEEISQQAGEMVKQLLTFAHKDFFQNKQSVPLDLLIKEGFNTAKLGISEDIELSICLVEQNVIVMCDANQIQQVLMNMMNNARDAVANSESKCIDVRLTVCLPDDGFFNRHHNLIVGKYACLSISDSGHGMGEDIREKIFDPFYTTKEVGEGTGLGLSSAFGTIESHNGVIEVESEINQGTTFHVYLPLVEKNEQIAEFSKLLHDVIENRVGHS